MLLISEINVWFCHHHHHHHHHRLLSGSWKLFKYNLEILPALAVLVSFPVPYPMTQNIRGVSTAQSWDSVLR
jgi:hypothetical protein